MQEFMRRWTGVIVLILGIGVAGLGIVALVVPSGGGVISGIVSIVAGLAIILAGLAINGISDGMNQIGDVLGQIMKGLQARQD